VRQSRCYVMVLLALVLSAGISAQAATGGPGYYPIEELNLFTEGNLEVDINLSGSAIKMAVGVTSESEPELSELMSSIEGIRVQVGSLRDKDPETVRMEIDRVVRDLEGSGWHRMVRVAEDDERVLVYSMELDDMIEGLTVLVVEGTSEAVLVNIVGRMDPEMLGRLMAQADHFAGLGLDLGGDVDDED